MNVRYIYHGDRMRTGISTTQGATMSVSGIGSALSTLTGGSAEKVQQTIAAKVLRDQMDSDAVMAARLLESGKQISQTAGTGSRVDFRA